MKVLIADDAAEIRDRLGVLLATIPGVEVAGAAGDGRAVLALAEQLHPDAVVLDLRMPEVSGWDVLGALKQAHPELLVIVLTNYSYPWLQERCRAAGADYFLDKFYEFPRVAGIVREHAARLARPERVP